MKKKIYHVTCDKNVAMSDMDLLVNGIELEDGHVYADEVTYVNDADRSALVGLVKNKKNPELYRDLVVRVGGYSDYFVKISPNMQAEVLLRTEHEM